ncbi:MAG: peptidoglycan DD-metalloendopeptidase family protein [Deltaproteobacteria bacterium]|nr:peptidoglycan DD-metalloendopeptidase family protein [Deltaproteobacteria bacterium]
MSTAKTPRIYSTDRRNDRPARPAVGNIHATVRRTSWSAYGEIPELRRSTQRPHPLTLRPPASRNFLTGDDLRLPRRRRAHRSILTPRGSLALLVVILVGSAYLFMPSGTDDRIAVPPLNSALLSEMPLPDAAARSRSRITHTVRSGDTVSTVLNRYGVRSPALDAKLSSALGDSDSPDLLGRPLSPKSTVSLMFNREGEVAEVKFRPKGAQYVSLALRDERFIARALERAVLPVADRVFSGVIRSSFAADSTKLGMSYDTIDDLVDLFGDRVEFRRDFHPGDRFTIILGPAVDDKGLQVKPPVLAAAFQVRSKMFAAVRYVGHDGKVRYFDETGAPLGNTFLRYPVKFSRVSSMFSDARFHPVLRRSRPHRGVDFAAPVGTPVRAVSSGQIVLSGYRGPSGRMVRIRHSDRFTTEYLHLSKITAGLTQGRMVAKGEVIGEVGCTGLCSGPHLHYGFFDRGKYVDPLTAKIPAEDLLGPGQAIERVFLTKVVNTLEHYQRSIPATLLASSNRPSKVRKV